MATSVDICNLALSHLGEDQTIASLDPPDRSVVAGHCARFYPIARRLALSLEYSFSFAEKRLALNEVTNDSDEWLFKYAIPSDMLKARRILTMTTDGRMNPETGFSAYNIVGQHLYTNVENAVLVYTFDQLETLYFSPAFVTGLAMLLTGYLAGPIIKGKTGAEVGRYWIDVGTSALNTAAASEANSSSAQTSEFTPESLQARA